MKTSIQFHNSNPKTIWNVLAVKLGREPTHQEAKAEVQCILTDSLIERAGQGKLKFQRRS